MTKEEWIESKYKSVDQLPSEYAMKVLVAVLLEEVYDLKKEVNKLKEKS